MKSLAIHYKNKFPGSKVSFDEHSLDVYSAEGEHLIAIRKNGAGQTVDCSEEFGCSEKHDLAPIPKDARIHKLHKDGKMGRDEKASEREEKSKPLICKAKGYDRVKSLEEYKAEGYEFSEAGEFRKAPAPEAPASEEKSA